MFASAMKKERKLSSPARLAGTSSEDLMPSPELKPRISKPPMVPKSSTPKKRSSPGRKSSRENSPNQKLRAEQNKDLKELAMKAVMKSKTNNSNANNNNSCIGIPQHVIDKINKIGNIQQIGNSHHAAAANQLQQQQQNQQQQQPPRLVSKPPLSPRSVRKKEPAETSPLAAEPKQDRGRSVDRQTRSNDRDVEAMLQLHKTVLDPTITTGVAYRYALACQQRMTVDYRSVLRPASVNRLTIHEFREEKRHQPTSSSQNPQAMMLDKIVVKRRKKLTRSVSEDRTGLIDRQVPGYRIDPGRNTFVQAQKERLRPVHHKIDEECLDRGRSGRTEMIIEKQEKLVARSGGTPIPPIISHQRKNNGLRSSSETNFSTGEQRFYENEPVSRVMHKPPLLGGPSSTPSTRDVSPVRDTNEGPLIAHKPPQMPNLSRDNKLEQGLPKKVIDRGFEPMVGSRSRALPPMDDSSRALDKPTLTSLRIVWKLFLKSKLLF